MSESYDDDMVTLDVTPFLSNSLGHRKLTSTNGSWLDPITNTVSSGCTSLCFYPMSILSWVSNLPRSLWGSS